MAACCSPQQLHEKGIDPSKLLDVREDDEFLYKDTKEEDAEESDEVEEIESDGKGKTDQGVTGMHKYIANSYHFSLPK